jgi:2-iminoacetate synthase ThiH
MIAVSRLMLDNVPNIKAYWIMMGMPLAQVALALRRERRPGHRCA